ncbi:MAG: hypothetical protein HYR63_00320 [Proteobacteria bacterium]|nr:hypothetical protein [Pseudomonadota bacterium]
MTLKLPPVVEHRPCLAALAEIERGNDGPIPAMALALWRHGSARAAERFHRRRMRHLARQQVLEAIRACRSWDEAAPEAWRDDTVARMRRLTRHDLRSTWQVYRAEMHRGR